MCVCSQEWKEAPVDATVLSLQRISEFYALEVWKSNAIRQVSETTVCILVSCLFPCRRMLQPALLLHTVIPLCKLFEVAQ